MAFDQNKEMSKLPNVMELEDGYRQKVEKLLERLDEVNESRKKLEDEEDDILSELTQIQGKTNQKGFRYGWLCFTATKTAGRKTLDKMLLIENGCPAAVINQSYKEGAPGLRRIFHRLKEEA